MSQQRLSRKEIKHDLRDDAFHHTVGAGYEYVAGHRRQLLLVLGGVVLAAALAAGGWAWLQRRESTAGERLSHALTVLEAPVVTSGARPEDPRAPSFADAASRDRRAAELLAEVHDRYGSTAAGAVAAVHLGRMRLDAGDEAAARELWEGFLEDHEDHLLASAVRVSLLDLDRRAGKAEQVAAELQAQLEDGDPELPEDVLLYELALTQEQLGKAAEARQAYQRISDEYPDSPFASRAATKARELGGGEQPVQALTVQPS